MKRSNVSAIVYLCLVFLSGVLVGGVGFRFYHLRSTSARSGPCGPEALRTRYINDMHSRLKLRPDQMSRLEAILEQTHERFTVLREKYRPDVRALQEEQARLIRAMLDDQQRAEYEKMRQERERDHRGGHEGRRPPPPPGS
ncbi:MAG: hypothetical protein ABSD27_00235 [Bryobacteraceae bacterium]|jgi:hypothetical protein